MSAALHEVDPQRRAGVAMDTITTSRQQWTRQHRRAPALSAREGLAALQFECLLIWTAAANLRAGVDLSQDDWERITVAMSRIDAICAEVLR